MELIKNDGGIKQDEIYQALIKYHSAKFVSLTKEEEKSVSIKELEYKELLKKAVQLTYILLNINPKQIKNVIYVFTAMSKQIPIQRKQFQYYSQRMSGYDQIG